MSVCPFCQETLASVPGYRRETFGFSIPPLNPVTVGHRLFAPWQHIESADRYPFVTGRIFAAAAMYAHNHGEAFNLITSAGAAATQTVPHLHIHYVPRRPGDGLHLPWTGQLRPSAETED